MQQQKNWEIGTDTRNIQATTYAACIMAQD